METNKDNKINKDNKDNKEKLQSKKKQKKNLKEEREKMYQKINHECSKINISEIRLEDFAESRKKELNQFTHILKNKFNNKTSHQLLPKHMRRRCMSHNPFRIPIKFRNSNITTVIRTRQFKHKRKRKYFII
jgi:ribonuclease P/MRP protein subunit POP1